MPCPDYGGEAYARILGPHHCKLETIIESHFEELPKHIQQKWNEEVERFRLECIAQGLEYYWKVSNEDDQR